MWKVVAGKIHFSEGKQYEIIENINTRLSGMMQNTDSHRAKVKLDLILRTMQSLTKYVDQMGDQIAHTSTAAENEAVLENIRFATSVMEEVVQDYVIYEVHRMEGQYAVMRESFAALAGVFHCADLQRTCFFGCGRMEPVEEHLYSH
jgi:hypothetical protein